jgi:preprotein translocase SecE subunit
MTDGPTPPRVQSLSQLALFGTVYAILAYLAVAHLVPWAYAQLTLRPGILSGFGLILAEIIAAIAVVYGWRLIFPRMEGLRAAVAINVGNAIIGFLLVFICGYILDGLFGALLTRMGGPDARLYIGWAMLAVIAFFWLRYMYRKMMAPNFAKRMQKIEEGGWFHGGSYKKLQGLKIRRITMLTLLLTVGFGIYYYYFRAGIGSLSTNTIWNIPFVSSQDLIVFRAAPLTVPIILLVLTVWFSYRLVNYPQFAEFLINTEAELAKVTWSTRKRLIRDTGVVLLTVLLLALFLYFFDILWVLLLQALQVLRS